MGYGELNPAIFATCSTNLVLQNGNRKSKGKLLRRARTRTSTPRARRYVDDEPTHLSSAADHENLRRRFSRATGSCSRPAPGRSLLGRRRVAGDGP